MKNFAEFAIIGNVGSVKKLNNATRISIASNYRRKTEDGAWTDDTHWNHVVVFSEATRKFIDEQVAKGSLIVARGRVRQSTYDKDGQTRYAVDLICNDFGLLPPKQPKPEEVPEAA